MKSKMVKWISGQYLLSVVVTCAVLLTQLSFTINADNLIYAIGQIRTFNSELFNNNVYMGEGVVSPRYIIDFIFGFLMNINGGRWPDTALVWIYFGLVIETIAIVNFAGRISREHKTEYAVIIALLFAYNQNTLAGFLLTVLCSTSIGPALAFAMLSISFVFGDKKNFKLAWIYAGCSVVCHIHEGIYCCVVVFIIVCVDSIVDKRIKIKENLWIFFPVAVLLLVAVPSMITDKMNITNSEFVYIYSYFRHPHHLVPSQWGKENIVKSFVVNISLFLLVLETIYLTKRQEIKRVYLEVGALMVAWLGALGLAYIFTERFPLAIVSTMFLSKSFKYVVLMAVIYTIYSLELLRNTGKVLSGYLLLFYAFMTGNWSTDQMLLYFLAFAVMIVLEHRLQKESDISSQILFTCDVVFFFIVLFARFFALNLYEIIKILTVFMVIGAVHIRMQKGNTAVITILGSILILLVSGFGVLYARNGGKFILQTGENAMRMTMGNDLYVLACQFEQMSDASDVFIADPKDTGGAGWFQIACKRNCYVLEKVIPSSKCTVEEWYERYISLEDFYNLSPDEIKNTMHDEKIDYALIKMDRFAEFDCCKDFEIVLTSPEDTYRLYQVRSK